MQRRRQCFFVLFFASDQTILRLLSSDWLKRIKELGRWREIRNMVPRFQQFCGHQNDEKRKASAMKMFIFLVVKIDEKKISVFKCKRHSLSIVSIGIQMVSMNETFKTSQMIPTSIKSKWVKVHWKKRSCTMMSFEENACIEKKGRFTQREREISCHYRC